jgi:hypothetical protein
MEDSGAHVITQWARNIVTGDKLESGQEISFTVIPENPLLFEQLPQINSNGDLIFSTSPNMFGETEIWIRIEDNGGNDNGGVSMSEPYTSVITIYSLNDPPSFIGVDSFSYVADDGQLQSNLSEIQIQVGGTGIQTPEDTSIDLTRILNAKTIAKWPVKGTLAIADTSSIPPIEINNGYDALTYIHEKREIVMTIYISPVNDPPTITVFLPIELIEDTPRPITIVTHDVDGDELQVNINTPGHGRITGTPPACLYYPDENYNGLDEMIIAVSDRSETTQMAVMLTIHAINDPLLLLT